MMLLILKDHFVHSLMAEFILKLDEQILLNPTAY